MMLASRVCVARGAQVLRSDVQRRLQHATTSQSYRVVPSALPEGFVVRSPQLEQREMRKIALSNGMCGLVVSDPGTPYASAAVSVARGSWSDGAHQGTAHFLEHLLFLGTTKYPRENEYDRFLHDNNGRFNAYTASDHTHYYFTSLFPDALPGAMDRFSRFFYQPLFTESAVEREMNAVEEEYKQNLISDGWRLIHVLKELSHNGHPFSQFNTGNLETMRLIDQDYLKRWYRDHYSADIMTFCVVGAEKMPELIRIAEESFLPIQRHDIPPAEFKLPIFPDSVRGSLLCVEPVKDTRELTLMWEIPIRFNDKKVRPTVFLSRVLQQATKGALLAVLKEKGLVETLGAYKQHMGGENLLYQISVSLTKLGEEQWQEVVGIVFAALRKFSNEKIPKYVFDEIYELDKIDYQYQERYPDMASTCCELLREEGIESFPRNSVLIEKFDPQMIQDLASCLTPSSAIMITMSRNPPFAYEKTEKWMHVKYSNTKLDTDLIQRWHESTCDVLSSPTENEFVPRHLQLVAREKTIPEKDEPILLQDSKDGKMYFYQDHKFLVPRCLMNVSIRSPEIRPQDARSLSLSSLFVRYINDSLTEMSYKASAAGMSKSVSIFEDSGVSISVSGYSERAFDLFKSTFNKVMNIENSMEEERFAILKDVYVRQLRNREKNPPYKQALDELTSTMFPERRRSQELAAEAEKITLSDLKAFAKRVFDKYYIQSYVGGNVTREDANNVWKYVHDTLSRFGTPTTLEATAPLKMCVPKSLNNESIMNVTRQLKVRGNGSVVSTYLGKRSNSLWVRFQVYAALVSEPFYSELRTKQQTGYIVAAMPSELVGNLFMHCLVQSDTHTCDELQKRTITFLDSFANGVKTGIFSGSTNENELEERFKSVKDALLSRLRSAYDSLDARLSHDMGLCFEPHRTDPPDFGRIQSCISELEKLTLEDIREFSISVASSKPPHSLGRIAISAKGLITTSKDGAAVEEEHNDSSIAP